MWDIIFDIMLAIMLGAFPWILFFLLWLGDLQIYDFPELYYRIPCYDMPGNWGYKFDVYVDRETRVQYLCLSIFEAPAKFIDSEGKPILYTGNFTKEESIIKDRRNPMRFYQMDADHPDNSERLYAIYVDRETRVQYAKFYKGDSIEPLLDRNEKPILYSGDFKE